MTKNLYLATVIAALILSSTNARSQPNLLQCLSQANNSSAVHQFDLVLPNHYARKLASVDPLSGVATLLDISMPDIGIGSIILSPSRSSKTFVVTRQPRSGFSLMGFYLLADGPVNIQVRTDLQKMTFKSIDGWGVATSGICN